MKFQTTHHLLFRGALDDFDERTDRLIEALDEMDGVEDVDLAASLTTGAVDLTFVVTEDDYAGVVFKAVGAVRAAIHAIGDGTPGWDARMREVSIEVTPLGSADDESVPAVESDALVDV